MKKIFLMLMFIATTTFFARAQTHQGPQKLPKALVKQLALSADQQTKIDAIFKNRATKIDSLTSQASTMGDKQFKRQRRMANADMVSQIEGVLTADQKKVYADFRVKQQEKMRAKKSMVDSTATPGQ